MVRVRPFVRVASNLSLTISRTVRQRAEVQSGALADGQGRGNAVAADETPGAEPDAEVSFVTRDLARHPAAREDRGLPSARGRHRACARRRGLDRRNPSRPITASLAGTTGSIGGGQRLAYAAEGDIDPYAGFEARIVPENITLLPKSAGKANAPAMPGTSARSR